MFFPGWLVLIGLFSSSALALELALPAAGEDVVGGTQTHIARYEDTFADLGSDYDLGYLELVAANPSIDAWLPKAGSTIVLPTHYVLPSPAREGIVINLPEYRLYYFKGERLYTYPLGIGREGWESPQASTRISAKAANPTWYPPESIRQEHAAEGDYLPKVVPPGPDNPLGPYKMTLALPGYLIHGSNKQFGVGMRVSHGCFRMHNHNVLALAAMAPVGTPVQIVNEPYKFGVSHGRLYLEAHAPLGEDELYSEQQKQEKAAELLLAHPLFAQAYQVDWPMLREAVRAQSGLPVAIGRVLEATFYSPD